MSETRRTRSGSETRARAYQVSVRLTEREMAEVMAAAAHFGWSKGEVLRRAFLENATLSHILATTAARPSPPAAAEAPEAAT